MKYRNGTVPLAVMLQQTDPKKHVHIVADANKRHSGNFVPLAKMIKGWNKTHGRGK